MAGHRGRGRGVTKKPALLEQAAVLLAKDVSASIAYYQDKLGFKATGTWGEPPEFAILKRDGCRIMIGKIKAGQEITPNWKQRDGLWNAYFWVNDAKALYVEMKAAGAIMDYGPELQPYGVLEFGIRDLDGHDIGFGQDLD
jgi:catechol 2,3-dioxygenase-like lactoylglutathione lyase family enzyme